MAKLIFMWYVINSTVVYQDTNEGKDLYSLHCKNGQVIELAYKAEILEYIETGTFEYNEDLECK